MSDSVMINKLVDDIINGDSVSAKESFEDAISLKITNALDQRKAEIAQQIYSAPIEDEITDVSIDNEVSEFGEEDTTEDNNE